MNLLHFILLIIIGEFKSYTLTLYATTKSSKGHNQSTSTNNYCNNEIQQSKQLKTKQSRATTIKSNANDMLEVQHYLNQQRPKLCQKEKSQNQHKNLMGPLQHTITAAAGAAQAAATTTHIENKYSREETRPRRKLSKRKVTNPSVSHEQTLKFSHYGYTYNSQTPFNFLTNDVSYVNDNILTKNDYSNWYYGQQPNDYNGRSQAISQQFLYAPKRSKAESKLIAVQKVLPYPPSFITFTTTKPPYAFIPTHTRKEIDGDSFSGGEKLYQTTNKSLRFHMPDFFANRQFTSLLDSYIPSWQIIKMMQNYHLQHKRNDLHTLAFVMPYKKHLSKRSLLFNTNL